MKKKKNLYDTDYVFDTVEGIIIKSRKMKISTPPERYFGVGTYRGCNNYVDTYFVHTGKRFQYAYTIAESWQYNKNFYKDLFAHIESLGLPAQAYRLESRIYPEKEFEKCLKIYYRGE